MTMNTPSKDEEEAMTVLMQAKIDEMAKNEAMIDGVKQLTVDEQVALDDDDASEEDSGDDPVLVASPTKSATAPREPSESSIGSSPKALKVLFLSSDTGGGHRASAESLAKQFQLLFPGTTYELLDIVERDGVPPYNSLVSYYKHLSSHPSQWKLVYSVSNSRAFELLADAHLKLMCERAVRRSIQSYDPDVVVSVHPLMTNVPVLSCSKISQKTGKHLPIFTVVTDLGSAHCLWFANGVEKMFVGSENVKKLAKSRGKVPEEKLVLAGLPIRHDFSLQAEQMGDRTSEAGQQYQVQVRKDLGLKYVDRKTILLMGGGEGVGSLANIAEALYTELVAQGIDAVILVVCGRNESLQESLNNRNWSEVIQRWTKLKNRSSSAIVGDSCVTTTAACDGIVTSQIRRMLATRALRNVIQFPIMGTKSADTTEVEEEEKKAEMVEASMQVENLVCDTAGRTDNSIVLVESLVKAGKVEVVGLGFVTRMAEYMVAADILVSKAGPGTISEAAAVSLPIMLTSFLPGQEEGNVDYVTEGGFGSFIPDKDPIGIAEEICVWLNDAEKMRELSVAAGKKGAPYAARDIAKEIGESTLKWKEINDDRAAAAASTVTTEASE